jgi:hypothetical protein
MTAASERERVHTLVIGGGQTHRDAAHVARVIAQRSRVMRRVPEPRPAPMQPHRAH